MPGASGEDMTMPYFHSVTLEREKCKGCTTCLKRCPTEAIRIRDGKASIIGERCIDCGECIRVCPYHAKVALTDPLAAINNFPYKIALPAPTLYGQFKNLSNIDRVLAGLLQMGFDDVFEVARAAEIVSQAIQRKLASKDCPRPRISSAGPAIVRLIQGRFPELIDNIVDVKSPMEVAALEAKRLYSKKMGVPQDQLGCFFITPCAAKMTAVRAPIGNQLSAVDGCLSILEVYGLLSTQIRKPLESKIEHKAGAFGVGWANSGGEALAVGIDNSLAVDGIEHVIRVLEEIENNKLGDLDFFEGLSCTGGCVGGPLVFEYSYVAKTRIRKLMERLDKTRPEQRVTDINELPIYFDTPIQPKNVMQLDDDIRVALQKMDQIDRIERALPGIDCGSCGSPTCRALAEDIVRGNSRELDCVFRLKERVRTLAQQMIELSDGNF